MIKPRIMRWTENITLLGGTRNEHQICIRTSEGDTQLGNPRHKCEDNIRMQVKERGWECSDGFIWFGIGTSGELLRTWKLIFEFNNALGIS
jgi:hypothetical protein